MGVIGLQCVVANGTRLLGMVYTNHYGDPISTREDYVALVQSNPSPASVTDITWSLVSVWPRTTGYPQDYSPLACNVDPNTGVFSMMSAFNLTDPTVTVLPPYRAPGGLQFDPRSKLWSNFTLSPDYKWGDYSSTFTLFQWPNTTTLYQANLGASTTVNIGMISVDDAGDNEFVNIASWDLNPAVYGYPSRLVYGNGVIYQFGTLAVNNRTGTLKNMLTRIPLTGNPATFKPPTNLTVYDASSLSHCTTSFMTASFYIDTLYVFCQGVDNELYPGYGGILMFKDGATRDPALGPFIDTAVDRFAGSIIQPIGGSNDGQLQRFAFMANAPSGVPMVGISLALEDIGNATFVTYELNITAPYGDEDVQPADHTAAIVGGSVAGGFLILGLLMYFLLRRRWPRWRRKLKVKIIEMMAGDDEQGGYTGNGHRDTDNINKIEDSSIQSFELDGRDKILVTDDMELDGIVDADTGYMQDVAFERHPRPKFATTLNTDYESSVETLSQESETETLRRRNRPLTSLVQQTSAPSAPEASTPEPAIPPLPPSSGATTYSPSAPHLHNNPEVASVSPPAQSMQPIFSRRKAIEAGEVIMAERPLSSLSDVAPAYTQLPNFSSLTTPPFPIPPTPTAPRFIIEVSRAALPNSPHAILETQLQDSAGEASPGRSRDESPDRAHVEDQEAQGDEEGRSSADTMVEGVQPRPPKLNMR